jgi:hypothetical protein
MTTPYVRLDKVQAAGHSHARYGKGDNTRN